MKRFVFAAAILAGCGGSPPPQTVAEPPAAAIAGKTLYVTATTLNIRNEGSTAGEIIGRARKGDAVSVLETRDGWARVRFGDGSTGWVSAQFLATEIRRRPGCPDDAEFRFAKTPTPAFSDREAHGIVAVEADVDRNGNVTATRIVSNTTSDDALGALAEREIREAKFVAPIRNCAAQPFIFTYKRAF